MAIFHLHAKVISRSDGRSATAAAAYRAGIRITDNRTGLVFDFTRRKCVAWSVIAAPSDASPWVFNREQLWNEVEQSEARRDAQVAREIEVAIPLELSFTERQKLIAEFVETEFVDRGMVADIAIHNNDGNPHCHILLTLRELLPNGFGKKVRDWNDKELLIGWRESWASYCNKALARNNSQERIDHRTLIAQGLNRIPARHEGVRMQRLRRRLSKRTKHQMREPHMRTKILNEQERGQAWSGDSLSRKPNLRRC